MSGQPEGRLAGRVAVITGGASGIGESSVRKFVAQGARVVIADIQEKKGVPLPEDIANAALWLASDEAAFVNGHALTVDGGLTGGRQWSEAEARREQLLAAVKAGVFSGAFSEE